MTNVFEGPWPELVECCMCGAKLREHERIPEWGGDWLCAPCVDGLKAEYEALPELERRRLERDVEVNGPPDP